MDVIENLKLNIKEALKTLGLDVSINDIVIENSKDAAHGDYASNVALKYAKQANSNPRDFANKLVSNISLNDIDHIEIAGPGFINFFMKSDSLTSVISTIINEDSNYGRGKRNNTKVNVEFVSANPTGALHVGHARGAAIGDSICRILDFAGYDVTREYYINDAGNQIDKLALSLQARYLELLNLPNKLPEDGYHGEDVKEVAKKILDIYGDKLVNDPNAIATFKKEGIRLELDEINKDLMNYRVKFDVYSSELVIRSDNAVEKELDYLKDHIYVDDGAKVLKTTDYLDDKDRVIVKSNGDYTYFLPDICYHVNKLSRGYDKLIDVLGADHHGYINRMKSALMMHGYNSDVLEIELIQMVRMMKDGEEFKLSKRTGNGYALRELCEDAGVDAARYFFAMRAASSHLDFDLDLAVKQSSDNPVYYVQYAHARLCSILEAGKEYEIDTSGKGLNNEDEMALLKHLREFPNIVNVAANELSPYKITNYVHDLAEKFHSFYSTSKVLDKNNIELTKARLGLCLASKIVISNALNLVGVSSPTHM